MGGNQVVPVSILSSSSTALILVSCFMSAPFCCRMYQAALIPRPFGHSLACWRGERAVPKPSVAERGGGTCPGAAVESLFQSSPLLVNPSKRSVELFATIRNQSCRGTHPGPGCEDIQAAHRGGRYGPGVRAPRGRKHQKLTGAAVQSLFQSSPLLANPSQKDLSSCDNKESEL